MKRLALPPVLAFALLATACGAPGPYPLPPGDWVASVLRGESYPPDGGASTEQLDVPPDYAVRIADDSRTVRVTYTLGGKSYEIELEVTSRENAPTP